MQDCQRTLAGSYRPCFFLWGDFNIFCKIILDVDECLKVFYFCFGDVRSENRLSICEIRLKQPKYQSKQVDKPMYGLDIIKIFNQLISCDCVAS